MGQRGFDVKLPKSLVAAINLPASVEQQVNVRTTSCAAVKPGVLSLDKDTLVFSSAVTTRFRRCASAWPAQEARGRASDPLPIQEEAHRPRNKKKEPHDCSPSEAEWKGTFKEGAGIMRLGSGAFEGAYSFPSRFESGKGRTRKNSSPPRTRAASRWRSPRASAAPASPPPASTPWPRSISAPPKPARRSRRSNSVVEGEVPGIDAPDSSRTPKPPRRVASCRAPWPVSPKSP